MKIKPIKSDAISKLSIRPIFSYYYQSEDLVHHTQNIKKILTECLSIVSPPFNNTDDIIQWICRSLPIINWKEFNRVLDCLTIFFLLKPSYFISVEKFLHHMMSLWLFPYQEISILSCQQMYFCFEHALSTPFFVSEVKILIRTQKELEILQKNLPPFYDKMKQAVQSGRLIKSLWETGYCPLSEKMSLAQHVLIRLLKRFSADIDPSIFEDFSYVQLMTAQEFKQQRSYVHLTRIVTSLHLVRSKIDREEKMFPEKRHMIIRYVKGQLEFSFGNKPVIGLAIGVNLLNKNESFRDSHVLFSIQKVLPHVRLVPGSLVCYQLPQSSLLSLYVEIEKENGEPFSLEERKYLKEHLIEEMSKSIEYLLPSLFMVRNEEETIRNILLLSEELKGIDDLPQMMVSFDQHSQNDLIFTVIFVRVKKEDSVSLGQLLSHADERIRFIFDRIQIVRYLEHVPIEANVFRLQIYKLASFLRMDCSVNVYLARQEIVSFLTRFLGEVRDYNGGMILKQSELLSQMKCLFNDLPKKHQELLENFFYSLNPIEYQATLSLRYLSLLFTVFLRQIENPIFQDECVQFSCEKDEALFCCVIGSNDRNIYDHMKSSLDQIPLNQDALITSQFSFEGGYYMSYGYLQKDLNKQQQFKEHVIQSMKNWQQEKEKFQMLRLGLHDFVSLDPRIGGDQESSAIIKILFDGLMRLDENGVLHCAVAKSCEISEDGKEYIFHLRESVWSNGDRVTAYDFEYSWKKILSPDFFTPFAYLFYPIKNAKLAKEGKLPIEQVGCRAVGEGILVVQLEHPASYFLELTSSTLYFPVNHYVDRTHPNWGLQKNEEFVCNGPFRLQQPYFSDVYELKKNPTYWDPSRIKLDQVVFKKVQGKAAFDMFKSRQIDFLGSHVCPVQNEELKELNVQTIHYPAPKLFWLCFNVVQFPFNNLKIRQSFGHALKRSEVQKVSAYDRIPAFTPLPSTQTYHMDSDFLIFEDEEKAKQLFDEGLKELGITKEHFPVIYICVSSKSVKREVVEKIKERWAQILGVHCEIEEYEWHELFARMLSGNFHIGAMHWTSWLNDPIYTMNTFKYRYEKMNFSNWENKEYQEALDTSDREIDKEKRAVHLAKAEEILIRNVVVLPIFYEMNWYVLRKDHRRRQLYFPKMLSNGILDLSQMYFKKH